MNTKCEKEKNILDMLLNVLIHQITALYEDMDEKQLDTFEENLRSRFRRIEKDKIENNDGSNLISNYINYEVSEYGYGYDDKQGELRYSLEELFYEFGSDIAVETRILRDEWKKLEFEDFNARIDNLKVELDRIQKEKDNLNDKFNKEAEKCTQLNFNIESLNKDLLEKIGQVEFLNNKINSLEEELLSEIDEKKDLLNTKSQLEEKISKLNEEACINTEKTNSKEIEHLKKGVEILREKLSNLSAERDEQEEINKKLEQKNIELESKLNENKKADEVSNQLTDKIKNIESILEREKESNIQLKNKINELEDKLQQKNNTIDEFKFQNDKLKNQKNKKNIDEVKRVYSNITKIFNSNMTKVLLKNKVLSGINMWQYVTQINKFKKLIEDSQNNEEISKHLIDVIKMMVNLEKILTENSININLNELIGMISKLEEEI
ncbi:hypothetical protein ACN077_23775 [Clostridium chromiireducens]|uniref:hypothetical protein n=1 Tax=Clostridium chromiireducens TaxID=225345 RepID=UPI003AF8B5F1